VTDEIIRESIPLIHPSGRAASAALLGARDYRDIFGFKSHAKWIAYLLCHGGIIEQSNARLRLVAEPR
jgi:hypothetical protein